MTPAPLPSPGADAVTRLHAEFCRLSGRKVDITFHQRAWSDLLQTRYGWDEPAMAADVKLLVRYLKAAIAGGKRNPGALKLSNFLAIDKFDEDLAEARVMLGGKTPVVGRVCDPAPGSQSRATEEATQETAARLREFRRSL